MGSYHDTIESLRDDPPGIRSVAVLKVSSEGSWHFAEAATRLMSTVSEDLAKAGFNFGEPVLGESIGVELRDATWIIALVPGERLHVELRSERRGLDDDARTRALLRRLDAALGASSQVSGTRWISRQDL